MPRKFPMVMALPRVPAPSEGFFFEDCDHPWLPCIHIRRPFTGRSLPVKVGLVSERHLESFPSRVLPHETERKVWPNDARQKLRALIKASAHTDWPQLLEGTFVPLPLEISLFEFGDVSRILATFHWPSWENDKTIYDARIAQVMEDLPTFTRTARNFDGFKRGFGRWRSTARWLFFIGFRETNDHWCGRRRVSWVPLRFIIFPRIVFLPGSW